MAVSLYCDSGRGVTGCCGQSSSREEEEGGKEEFPGGAEACSLNLSFNFQHCGIVDLIRTGFYYSFVIVIIMSLVPTMKG